MVQSTPLPSPCPPLAQLPVPLLDLAASLPFAPKPFYSDDSHEGCEIVLIVELARPAADDGSMAAPPVEAFEFADEEVAKIEEEEDPFDML